MRWTSADWTEIQRCGREGWDGDHRGDEELQKGDIYNINKKWESISCLNRNTGNEMECKKKNMWNIKKCLLLYICTGSLRLSFYPEQVT